MDLVARRARRLTAAEEIEQGVPDLGGIGPESRIADRPVLAHCGAVYRDAAAGRLDDDGATAATVASAAVFPEPARVLPVTSSTLTGSLIPPG
jgi:hypothetical protein